MRRNDIDERPMMLGNSNRFFSILTVPCSAPSRTGIVILNAGLLHHVGPFRLHVDIARVLGKDGFVTLRVDQSGKGESPKRTNTSRLDSILSDYDDCLATLRSEGVEDVILLGLCSGADDASYIASRRDSIAGLILLDGFARKTIQYYLRHYGPRILSPQHWGRMIRKITSANIGKIEQPADELDPINLRDWDTDAAMLWRYADQLNRGVKILAVYADVQSYYNHPGQLSNSLPSGTKLTGLKEIHLPDSDHTYSSSHQRQALIEIVREWLHLNFQQ